MNNKQLYQDVIKNAGYGIEQHEHPKQRFIQKKLVEVAFRMGVKAGLKDKKVIDKLLNDFDRG